MPRSASKQSSKGHRVLRAYVQSVVHAPVCQSELFVLGKVGVKDCHPPGVMANVDTIFVQLNVINMKWIGEILQDGVYAQYA